MSSQWYEAVTKASTTFGNYVEDILGTKLARALPNNVILLPSDKVKLSLLLIERLSSDIWYCPEWCGKGRKRGLQTHICRQTVGRYDQRERLGFE